MTLSDRLLRLIFVALAAGLLAFLAALLIVMSQNGHQGGQALFVYGP